MARRAYVRYVVAGSSTKTVGEEQDLLSKNRRAPQWENVMPGSF